mmetsp:Transcript_29900/g.103322  ORF Transcript_29900/g.103322 Transcript_29900/m.103322 type:complete len:313 (+) Transcript_29900:696-1634(+)
MACPPKTPQSHETTDLWSNEMHPRCGGLSWRPRASHLGGGRRRRRRGLVGLPLPLLELGHVLNDDAHFCAVVYQLRRLLGRLVDLARRALVDVVREHKCELRRPLLQQRPRRRELGALSEERGPSEDVEPQSRARHGHDQAPDVAHVPHGLCAHEREEDVVVLLALVFVHGCDLAGHAVARVVLAPLRKHIPQKVLLAVIRCQHANARGRVAEEAHVHVRRDYELGFSEVLVKVRRWRRFPSALKVLDVHQLVLVRKARVGVRVRARGSAGQVAELLVSGVAPIEQAGDGRPRAALRVQKHARRAQARKARE